MRESLWEYGLGNEVLYQSERDPRTVLLLARLPMMLLTLAFGLAVYGFACNLFGYKGGLTALAAYTFDPTLIAHGRMVTTDVPVNGFLLLTFWLLWRGRDGNVRLLALAGGAYGLALASKFTALPLAAVLLLVLAIPALTSSQPRRLWPIARKTLRRALIFFAAAISAVWMVYLAVDPHQHFDRTLEPYEEVYEETTGFLPQLINTMPLPSAFRYGAITNLGYDEMGRDSFLVGRRYHGGWILFYPIALLLKSPATHIGLWAFAAWCFVRQRAWAPAAHLLLPAVFLLAFAMLSSTNIGVRHVLIVPLFFAVMCGAIVSVSPLTTQRVALVATALFASAASAWHQYPSYLAYTTDLAGGRSAGHRLLADSNIDWGQDLSRLGSYVKAGSQVEPIWLSYFGTAAPLAYGIEAREPPADGKGVRGLVAVSVTRYNLSPDSFRWLRNHQPVAIIGGSILVFDLG